MKFQWKSGVHDYSCLTVRCGFITIRCIAVKLAQMFHVAQLVQDKNYLKGCDSNEITSEF